MPRTTVGMLSAGVKEEGLSTMPGVNRPRGAGARPRNQGGVAGGCELFADEDVGAVRLGDVRSASESVLFVALRGDNLKAIFRRAAMAARDSITCSFWRARQPLHCPVNLVGSLTLRNSNSGRSRLQVWQLQTAWVISSAI